MHISNLFIPEPVQWGLRGDPHLWRELKVYFEGKELPGTAAEMEQLLVDGIGQLVGARPINGVNIRVDRYPRLGMSGGLVSGRFWVERGIPMLVERYVLAVGR